MPLNPPNQTIIVKRAILEIIELSINKIIYMSNP